GHLLDAQLRRHPVVVELCAGDNHCGNFRRLYGALCRGVVIRGKASGRLGDFSCAYRLGGERMATAAGGWRRLECARLFASLSTGNYSNVEYRRCLSGERFPGADERGSRLCAGLLGLSSRLGNLLAGGATRNSGDCDRLATPFG